MGPGYLVYLGFKRMWDPEYSDCPYKQRDQMGEPIGDDFAEDTRPDAGWIDPYVHVPNTLPVLNNLEEVEEKIIYSPENLTIEQANKHLRFGFYDSFEGWENLDRRLLPGEFIIMEEVDAEGEIKSVYKIDSPSYTWRSSIRDNDPNLLHRFYQLVSDSYNNYKNREDKDKYKHKYPILTPYDKKSIMKMIVEKAQPFVVWPQNTLEEDRDMKTRDELLYNVWLNFLISVPLHKQLEAVYYLDHLLEKRKELINWFLTLEKDNMVDPVVYSRRVVQIITSARDFAQRNVQQGKNYDRRGKQMLLSDMVQRNIRNFIFKEEGGSLYRLIREMERCKMQVEVSV